MNLEEEILRFKALEAEKQVREDSSADLVKEFITLLEFLAAKMKGTSTHPVISLDHVLKLHKLLTSEESRSMYEDLFYSFLTKEITTIRQDQGFLHSVPILTNAFKVLFCSQKDQIPSSFTLSGFQCFKKLFIVSNDKEGLLVFSANKINVKSRVTELLGIENLWNVALKS